MQLANLRPSKHIEPLFHSIFTIIYLLLIIRAGISLYEGPIDISNLPNNSLLTLIIKRICGILYAPFFAVIIPPEPDSEGWFISTIIFAMLGYMMIHYRMFMSVNVEQNGSMADKILKFCRAMFFLAGTLLILLIVARMGVMLYQDLVFGRVQIGIGSPARK